MHWLVELYGPFFDLKNWELVITSGEDWLIILSLAVIECLLSVDNAVVLAAQTQVLPDKVQREKSLFYGLWGAYIFRFIVIGLGTYLIHIWEIKVLGAAYLFYLAIQYFRHLGKTEEHQKLKQRRIGPFSQFWSVVISIEMMDIVFSVDSVLASLAVSTNPVVILIGGMIGILCMRGVAEVIMRLMEKIPELETMAYVLIAIIALKLFLSIPSIDIEIPAVWFAGIVAVAVLITVIIHIMRKNKKGAA